MIENVDSNILPFKPVEFQKMAEDERQEKSVCAGKQVKGTI
jgi:hypothetical protein